MKRFRVAVAACGWMSQEWIKYALSRKDLEIVALMDIDEKMAKKRANDFGLKCGIYTDIAKAIEDSGANLVFDITPPAVRKKTVITALEMGCDVFGEKPMAQSLQDAKDMISVADKTGRMYAVTQNRRYLKPLRGLRELIKSGKIGKPSFVCADFFIGLHNCGFRLFMKSPLLVDMAIHTFDKARFLIGSNPVSVHAYEFSPKGSWYKGDACAICTFEFADGTIFSYRGSWCTEGCVTSWDSTWRIAGVKGTAVWDGFDDAYYEIPLPSGKKEFGKKLKRLKVPGLWKGRKYHFGVLDEMFSALIDGRRAETDCRDNIKSLAMVFAAVESASKGKKVKIKY